jgi:hypothetical protein
LSTNFGVLVCVVGFWDPSAKDPNSYTNLFPNPNSNGCPFANFGLLAGTCNFGGLNTTTWVCVPTLFVYSLVTCRPPFVCCFCCCCKCYCKCCKCCGLSWLSIQSS